MGSRTSFPADVKSELEIEIARRFSRLEIPIELWEPMVPAAVTTLGDCLARIVKEDDRGDGYEAWNRGMGTLDDRIESIVRLGCWIAKEIDAQGVPTALRSSVARSSFEEATYRIGRRTRYWADPVEWGTALDGVASQAAEIVDQVAELQVMADRLRTIRAHRGLKQIDVARGTNVSQASLSLYEKARRDPQGRALRSLARFYGVSVDWILGLDDFESGLGDS